MLRWVAVLSLLVSTPTLADPSAFYLKPDPKTGDRYYDVFSNTDSIRGAGFDPYAKRVGGSTLDTVVTINPDSTVLNENYEMDALMEGADQFEFHDGGKTICAKEKCRPNTSTSSIFFNPLIWGDIPQEIGVGSTWTATVANPWEIGPAGSETVRVVQMDKANGTIILEREGFGTGPTADDLRNPPPHILRGGQPLAVTLSPGATQWSGYIVVRKGVTLSEIIKSERNVTLTTDKNEKLQGHERNYTLYNLAP